MLNFFWLGYLLYIFFYSLTSGANVNFIIIQLFQSAGLGLMFFTAGRLLQFRFDNAYLGLIFRFYMVWLAAIVIRGFTTDFELIKKLLFDGWFGVFIYAAPIFLMFPRNLYFYKRVFDVIVIMGVLTLLLYLWNFPVLSTQNLNDYLGRDVLETVSKTLGIPAGFILMTYPYHSRFRKILAWVVMGMTIFFAIIQARRGLIVMAMGPVVITYMLYLYRAKVKAFVIVGSAVLGLAVLDYGYNLYMESDTFRYLQQRGLEDTRSGVEKMYFEQMEVVDWMIGRGMNGAYYCPGIDEGEISGWRTVIETDFLQVILKGGLISLGLFLMIAIPAVYLGLFHSKNTLTKAGAVWIFLAILNMYPSTVNTFTMNYLLVWIAVGMCYSPVIRNMPEILMKDYFLGNRIDQYTV